MFMWMDFAQHGDLNELFYRYHRQYQQQVAAGQQPTRVPESFIWHVIQCLAHASEAMLDNIPTIVHREYVTSILAVRAISDIDLAVSSWETSCSTLLALTIIRKLSLQILA